jgi:succinate dehydrogenase / fumarate reductase cytochrome b subunit
MSAGSNGARPLSPHLQVWRWHLTMATSILHRASGVALYAGAVLLTVWLLAIASGPEAYDAVEGFLLSWPGRALLFAFTAAAMYHLANGVRHLFWDAGKCFAPGTATATGIVVIVFAAAATLAIWFAAYAV